MPGYMVIVRSSAVVNQVEAITVSHPVLLGVVVPQIAAVIELPRLNRTEIHAVVTGANVAPDIVSKREKKPPAAAGERGLIHTSTDFQSELDPLFDKL